MARQKSKFGTCNCVCAIEIHDSCGWKQHTKKYRIRRRWTFVSQSCPVHRSSLFLRPVRWMSNKSRDWYQNIESFSLSQMKSLSMIIPPRAPGRLIILPKLSKVIDNWVWFSYLFANCYIECISLAYGVIIP